MHPWIRLNRVIRDIPSQYVLGGVDAPNMRPDVLHMMAQRGPAGRRIRCREVGGAALDAATLTPPAACRVGRARTCRANQQAATSADGPRSQCPDSGMAAHGGGFMCSPSRQAPISIGSPSTA